MNDRSVVHAGSAGQSTAFPDVNLCPPAPPAGPIPTPLPNLVMAADLQGGCSSVLVEGNPMGKKSSFIGKSTGNEVAQSTGGGVVSHVVQGKGYFTSYSLDVTVEGEEVPRHLDMLTQNHAAQTPPNAAMGTYLAVMSPSAIPPSKEEQPDRKDQEIEFFIDQVDGKPPSDVSGMVLVSADEAYNETVSVKAGSFRDDLLWLKFKKVLPGKFYSLFWEVSGERMPIFENVPFSRIASHTAGMEDYAEAPDEEDEEDEEDEDEDEDEAEDEDQDEVDDDAEAADGADNGDGDDAEDDDAEDGDDAEDDSYDAQIDDRPVADAIWGRETSVWPPADAAEPPDPDDPEPDDDTEAGA